MLLKISKLLLLIILTTALLCTFNIAFAEENGITIDQKTGLKAPALQIDIPNLSFSENNKGLWIGQYIEAVYNYAIRIVGILAAVVLMWGGLMWLTAGGNQGRVTEAKAWITASLTGLIIALASYTLLYMINPDLVKFNSLNIKDISSVAFEKPKSMFTEETDYKDPVTGEKVILRTIPVVEKVYQGRGTPLADDPRMINPLQDKRIKDIIGSGAQDTANIESNMADALAGLEDYINNVYNNEMVEKNRLSDIIQLKINSLNDGDHGQGDTTHGHGRAADIININGRQAGVIGEWWINQGQGRRFIWEKSHLHLDIGYPSGIRN